MPFQTAYWHMVVGKTSPKISETRKYITMKFSSNVGILQEAQNRETAMNCLVFRLGIDHDIRNDDVIVGVAVLPNLKRFFSKNYLKLKKIH